MCEINWGSVADWAAAMGSVAAVITALYLSMHSQKIKLKGFCGHRTIFDMSGPQGEVFLISVTNVGNRSTVIKNIGLKTGAFRKRFAVITVVRDKLSDGVPKPIADGEEAKWTIPLEHDRRWLKDLCQSFVTSRLDVYTLRVVAYTSHGTELVLRPEKNLRIILNEIIRQKRS